MFCVHSSLREDLGDTDDLSNSCGRGPSVRISTRGDDTARVVLAITDQSRRGRMLCGFCPLQ